MPNFSVILSVYYVKTFLPRCIERVLLQTYKDYGLILIDDISTDKSGMIYDSYAKLDSRIKVIHTENGGASSAQN